MAGCFGFLKLLLAPLTQLSLLLLLPPSWVAPTQSSLMDALPCPGSGG